MWDFLKGGEDYWLSMDDDNPPTKNPLDLVELDLDLIGLPTPVWHSAVLGDRPYYYNALDKVGEEGYKPHEPAEDLQEVDAVGSGCFLVSRRVIERIAYTQPFMREWGKDGVVIKGGDFSFCDKVKKAGFKVWTHFDYPCLHFNEVELTEAIRAFMEMKLREDMDA